MDMIKRFFLLVVLAIVSITAFSQIFEPVKWSYKLNVTGKTTADIVIRASIDEGWHLYGLNIPDGGPKATSVVIEKPENATKVGELPLGLSSIKSSGGLFGSKNSISAGTAFS
jgi:thiol:disulfide interchange protein DsbD